MKKSLLVVLFLSVFASSAIAAPYLWNNYVSAADIKDGRADYSNAKFSQLTLQVEDDEVRATRTYAAIEGSMTIHGGIYSIADDNNNILQTVSEQPKTFNLVFNNGLGDDYVSYHPMLDNKRVYFIPESGTGMNGVKVSWKFPEMPSLDGERILPVYKTPDKQLKTSLVPYFNMIIKKGNIEELDYGLINAGSKKIKFLTPSDKTSMRMYADFNDSRIKFRYKWLDYDLKNKKSGGYWYHRPKGFTAPANDLRRVRLRVRKYDSDGNLYVYQWNFNAPSSK